MFKYRNTAQILAQCVTCNCTFCMSAPCLSVCVLCVMCPVHLQTCLSELRTYRRAAHGLIAAAFSSQIAKFYNQRAEGALFKTDQIFMQSDKADKEVISVSDQSDCDDVINEAQDFRLYREGL